MVIGFGGDRSAIDVGLCHLVRVLPWARASPPPASELRTGAHCLQCHVLRVSDGGDLLSGSLHLHDSWSNLDPDIPRPRAGHAIQSVCELTSTERTAKPHSP